MSGRTFINLCSQLAQFFEHMTDADYVDFMRMKFRVYEQRKDANIDITLTRLQNHYSSGFFDLDLTEQPLLLTEDGE